MASRISVLALAAGLGLVGGVVILETLGTASSGPSGRVRPAGALPSGPPPLTRAPPESAPSSVPVSAVVHVSGIVVDEERKPLPGASVRGPEGMRIHQYHSWLFTVETDGEGRFRTEFVPREWREDYRDNLCSHVNAAGFLEGVLEGRPEHWETIRKGGRIEGLRIVLRRAASVEGTIRDAAGLPSKRAFVEYWTGPLDEENRTYFWHEWADGDGRFRIEGLDPLDDTRIRASNWGASSGERCLSGLLRGGEFATVNLELGEPTGERARFDGYWEIRGTVVDPEGKPVAGAGVNGTCFQRVPGEGYDAVTAEDGRFEGVLAAFDHDYEAGRQLTVRHAGHAHLQYHLRDDEVARLEKDRALDGLVFRLRPGAALRGRVLDPEGKPVARAKVRVTDRANGDRNPPWILHAQTDDAGAFGFRDIDPDAEWFLLADKDHRVSRYVPLGGMLRAGGEAVVDIPFPFHRELQVEVFVRGWKEGMSLSPDSIGEAMDGPLWTGSRLAGPHGFTLYDAADHPIAWADADIPYEAESWRIEMEAGPCEECAKGKVEEKCGE